MDTKQCNKLIKKKSEIPLDIFSIKKIGKYEYDFINIYINYWLGNPTLIKFSRRLPAFERFYPEN